MASRTPAKAGTKAGRAELNGLGDRVTRVKAAREKLGADMDRLDREVRVQVATTTERTVWRVGATVAAIGAGIVMRRVLVALWTRLRHANPPSNPAAPSTTWPEALGWSLATGAAVGVARLLATRGAAAGWRAATGVLPPGMEEVSA